MGEAKRVAKHRAATGYSHKAHAVPIPNRELDPAVHPEFFRVHKDVQPEEAAALINAAFDNPRERALQEAYGNRSESPNLFSTPSPVRDPQAGKRGGICYRTACQKPDSAVFFNHSTHKWYCKDCAHWLNTDVFNKRDALEHYGEELCIPEDRYDAMSDEDKRYGKNLKRDLMRQEQKDAAYLAEGKSAYLNIGD